MTVGRLDSTVSGSAGRATGWNDEFEGRFIRGYIVEVEVEPTLVINNCDTEVENLRLPPVSKDCPPGQLSSLIEGCAEYNQGPLFDSCVTHIANELKRVGLITEKERQMIVTCDPI